MSDIDLGTSAAQRRLLDAFLVDNQELELLNARLSAFNLFNVLRIERVEIRHSNVLAWLLSPNETHGLGANFLRRFLSRLLMDHEEARIPLTPAQVELMDFNDVEVLREWQNIDVVARSRSDRWCLMIENKVKGGETRDQLVRYLKVARTEMPDHVMIPVFLTLEGEDPSSEAMEAGYLRLSHTHILELAEQIVSQHRSRIPDDARVLLDHYFVTLRRLTMQDQELIDLCKAIYRKHRDAIELIIEYGSASNVIDACKAEIESQVECEFAKALPNSLWFLPKEMGNLLPDRELNGWTYLPRKSPVMWWFYYTKKQGQLKLVLEVGPMMDGQTRIRLLEAIRSAGLKVREAGFREEAKYTRILSLSQRLKPDEEGDPDTSDESVRQSAAALWTKLSKEGAKIIEALKGFEWTKTP